MKIFFLFILCMYTNHVVFAQVVFPKKNKFDASAHAILQELDVKQDPRLEKMLNWHTEKNKKRAGIDGFRVEIFFSSALDGMKKAFEKKVEFLSMYPDYTVHVKYEVPNFRVRVGDFRTKNEALKLHKKIQGDYRLAFIVPDKIDFPLLKPLNYE